MTVLTLVATTAKPVPTVLPEPSGAPLPTMEFLQRMLRALPLGEGTLGSVLDEAIAAFETPEGASIQRSAKLSDQLREVGLWLCHPTEDDDPPLFAQVVYPDRLIGAYPSLKRNLPQLSGLTLHRSRTAT